MIEVCKQYLSLLRYCDSGIDVHYAASASLLCILANVCCFLWVMDGHGRSGAADGHPCSGRLRTSIERRTHP